MNPERLLQHFDAISEAPDAITRLRGFILELAVRGKLVEQEAGDEPASSLLKRVQSEKARLVDQRKIKVSKQIGAISSESKPYEVPTGWQWTPLDNLVNSHLGGGTPSKNSPAYWGGDIPWASVKDIGKSKYVDDTIDRISQAGLDNSSSNLIGPNALIVVTRMGLGKVSINRIPLAINQDLRALSLSSIVSIDYMYLFFKTQALEGSGLTVKGIKVEELLRLPTPLPPLAEQYRIVAKVDELMALCDRLQAAREAREHTRDRMVAASLHRLTVNDVGNSEDVIRRIDHVRFHLQNLTRFISRSEHIKQFRRKILFLAARGRLVAQDPADEPAAELLAKVAKKRSSLLKAGLPNLTEASAQQRKQERQSVPQGLDALPSGWCWATLLQCSAFVVDCHNKTAPYSKSGIVLLRTTNIRDGRVNLKEPKFVDEKTYERWSARCEPQPGDILITREAPMGEVAIIPDGMMVCLGQRMMLARLVQDLIDPNFMLYSLRDPDLMNRVQDKPVGATVQHLRVGGVETLLVPLPPLAEQHRIVVKVDELIALCDKIEANLDAAQFDRSRLLDALLQEALQPAVARKDGGGRDKWRARSAISSYVVSRLSSKRSFGRTAHMKHLYLAEAHLGLELDGAYARGAAGPLDARIYDLEKQATSSGWYSPRVEVLTSGQEKVTYSPGKSIEKIVEEGISFLGSSRAEMDRVLGLMGDMSTEEVEIIATLFAVWNDALIDSGSLDDEWIVKEVREHWHKSKQRFTPAELKKWLGWMRANDLVPSGRFPRTIQQTTLDF